MRRCHVGRFYAITTSLRTRGVQMYAYSISSHILCSDIHRYLFDNTTADYGAAIGGATTLEDADGMRGCHAQSAVLEHNRQDRVPHSRSVQDIRWTQGRSHRSSDRNRFTELRANVPVSQDDRRLRHLGAPG